MLTVKDLNVSYGAIHAIHDVNLEVHDGEIVSLIGANGAGKTTILHTITGLKKATSGTVEYNGKNLLQTVPSEIITTGVAHVPEGRHIFPTMTVLENLEMGAYIRNDKEGIQESIQEVFQRFPRLKERSRQLAGTLSGGEQQMLAVGRALMSKPSIILMDEPSMGLSPPPERNLQYYKRSSQSGNDGSSCGTECKNGPCNFQQSLCAGDRTYYDQRRCGRTDE